MGEEPPLDNIRLLTSELTFILMPVVILLSKGLGDGKADIYNI